MRSILEIKDDIRTILDAWEVDEETGEIMIDFDALQALQLEHEEKIEGVALMFKETRYLKEAMKEEIKTLQARVKALDRKEESLKDWAVFATEGKKFTTPKVSISFRKTERVEVVDVEVLPEEYRRVKTTVEPDKIALKEALKDGEIISGARLVQGLSTIIK